MLLKRIINRVVNSVEGFELTAHVNKIKTCEVWIEHVLVVSWHAVDVHYLSCTTNNSLTVQVTCRQ